MSFHSFLPSKIRGGRVLVLEISAEGGHEKIAQK